MRPGGEYREEGQKDRSLWHARTIFLEKVAELATQVLESLRDDVLPVYQHAYEATEPNPEWTRWRWQDGDWQANDTGWPDAVTDLRDEILQWSRDWNLREDWIRDVAQRTLDWWYVQGDVTRLLNNPAFGTAVEATLEEEDLEGTLKILGRWQEPEPRLRFRSPRLIDIAVAPRFEFCFSPWVPQWELWRDYEEQLFSALEERLEEYRFRRQKLLEDEGREESVEIRAIYHFDWLVLWQVKESSYREIADRYDASTYATATGQSSGTVRKGVHDKAELIGLTLRTQYD